MTNRRNFFLGTLHCLASLPILGRYFEDRTLPQIGDKWPLPTVRPKDGAVQTLNDEHIGQWIAWNKTDKLPERDYADDNVRGLYSRRVLVRDDNGGVNIARLVTDGYGMELWQICDYDIGDKFMRFLPVCHTIAWAELPHMVADDMGWGPEQAHTYYKTHPVQGEVYPGVKI